ncbi:nuclear nucleic acid-binding protein C1D [Halyomorpha halys]|uniref:nuclear nucleic acid-binding protein C1D n=1 Tax=Halyomorpha halys TaxID=286706 RepID=UPI0006D4F2C9|nr:nuclear nucleic acid-binding protein C1D [Halyomorpha halys]
MDVDTPSYDDLSHEKDLLEKLNYFKEQIHNLENVLKPFYESDIYSDLTTEERVEYDIFLSYTLTSLYWMYVKTIGEDPFQHSVKGEVDRVQEYVTMYNKIKDRKKAPCIDKDAAQRFIKRGIGKIPSPDGKRKVFDDASDDELNAEEEIEIQPKLIL